MTHLGHADKLFYLTKTQDFHMTRTLQEYPNRQLNKIHSLTEQEDMGICGPLHIFRLSLASAFD